LRSFSKARSISSEIDNVIRFIMGLTPIDAYRRNGYI
jgi:hypothetical protein